jgi:hypothetical protein
MKSHASHMPTRFPVGTKLVIESHRTRDGQPVYARHLEFPDGTLFPLPSRSPRKPANRAQSRRARSH